MKMSIRAAATTSIGLAVMLTLAGCSATPTITGSWAASDGSQTKVINDDGSCSGMYYNGAKVLDIGGAETCTLSSESIVRQPPNQETLQVKFDGDTMTLYSSGSELVTLTKQ